MPPIAMRRPFKICWLAGRSAITTQVEMGVAIRMACLDVLTRRSRGVEGWS